MSKSIKLGKVRLANANQSLYVSDQLRFKTEPGYRVLISEMHMDINFSTKDYLILFKFCHK